MDVQQERTAEDIDHVEVHFILLTDPPRIDTTVTTLFKDGTTKVVAGELTAVPSTMVAMTIFDILPHLHPVTEVV